MIYRIRKKHYFAWDLGSGFLALGHLDQSRMDRDDDKISRIRDHVLARLDFLGIRDQNRKIICDQGSGTFRLVGLFAEPHESTMADLYCREKAVPLIYQSIFRKESIMLYEMSASNYI